MNAQLEMMLLVPNRPRKARNYHDTTHLPSSQLSSAIARADSQDAAVLAVFRAHPYRGVAPSECLVLIEAAGGKCLISSVRRSISTLTDAGALRMTADKKPGPWMRPESVWALVGPEALAA